MVYNDNVDYYNIFMDVGIMTEYQVKQKCRICGRFFINKHRGRKKCYKCSPRHGEK